jgi:hypothetical protein
MHVEILLPLDSELLIAGLTEAMLTTKDWLTPGQLLELCMGGSEEELIQHEADQAYAWMLRHIKDHGRDGQVKYGPYLGLDGNGLPIYGPDVPCPEIPETTRRTLEIMGGTVRGGIDRIGLAETKEQPHVKREFLQVYGRTARLG